MSWKQFLRGKKKIQLRLGIYGEVNAGKSTLANKIGLDWAGIEFSAVSEIPHETRSVQKLENVEFKSQKVDINLTLLDMPGIASSINPADFFEHGIKGKEALQRAKEATKGIVEAIKYLEGVDVALVILDSTRTPFDQVNFTILGNLEHQKKPFILVPNKSDLPESDVLAVKDAFEEYKVMPISALTGEGIEELYTEIAKIARKL